MVGTAIDSSHCAAANAAGHHAQASVRAGRVVASDPAADHHAASSTVWNSSPLSNSSRIEPLSRST